MTAEVYEEVEVDSCPSGHGTWLDYGEIKKIIQTTSRNLREFVASYGPLKGEGCCSNS